MIAKGIHLAYANNVLYIDGRPRKSFSESCRFVFKISDDLILKAEYHRPSSEAGAWKQCGTEARVLANIKPKDQPYFPIFYATGVMVDDSEEPKDGVDGVTWVLVENIHFSERTHTVEEGRLVCDLAERYSVGDLCTGSQRRNWTINAKTDMPVIFDAGMKGW